MFTKTKEAWGSANTAYSKELQDYREELAVEKDKVSTALRNAPEVAHYYEPTILGGMQEVSPQVVSNPQLQALFGRGEYFIQYKPQVDPSVTRQLNQLLLAGEPRYLSTVIPAFLFGLNKNLGKLAESVVRKGALHTAVILPLIAVDRLAAIKRKK